jgi:acetylornithine deacetylase/succinyl-diaminopimelate desuccinylase-like protein
MKHNTSVPRRTFFSPDFYKALVFVFVLTGAIWGITAFLRATTPHDRTYIPKPEVILPETRLLQQYVRIETTNPPGNEMAGARFLVDQLAQNGIQAELIESAPGRANVYARLRGKRPGQGLLILHHIDVVPATEEGWDRPPFSAEIYVNQIWGRGTLDMKGIGICHLLAFIDVARAGRQPERDLVFLATADEERGGELGLGWLIHHRPDIFEGVRYALNEGGIPEMKAEKLVYLGVEVGSKLFGRVRLRSAERPPLERARIALEPLMHPFDPERILPEVRQFYKAVAPYRIRGQEILADVDRAVAEGRFWFLHSGFRTLTQNTVAPGAIEGKRGQFLLDVILLNLPDEDPQNAIRRVRDVVQPLGVELDVMRTMEPAPISSTEHDFFRLIQSVVQRHHGPEVPVGPVILSFTTTDSRFLRSIGIQSYGLPLFFFDYHQSEGIHGVNERIRLDWFSDGVKLSKDLVRSYCFEADK